MDCMQTQQRSDLHHPHDLMRRGTVSQSILYVQLQPWHIKMCSGGIESTIHKLLYLKLA